MGDLIKWFSEALRSALENSAVKGLSTTVPYD